MSSESTEEESLSLDLPADLRDWLETHAAEEGLDADALLVQLIATYREANALGDGEDAPDLPVDEDAVVEAVLARLDGDADVADLERRVDALESDVEAKIQDVRERVVQVKQEADRKAPADHTHEDLVDLSGVEDRLATVEERLADVQTALEEESAARESATDDLRSEIADVEERLETVAWVVSDLREAHESEAIEAVDRIKRAAAQADVATATCEHCGDSVRVSLLTEPHCPHCSATVTDISPPSGWFGSATLLVASQLESGEEQ